jgi:citrate lyase beta subunit
MNQEDWKARAVECPFKPNYDLLQNDPFSKLVKEFGRAHENQQFALANKEARRLLTMANTSKERFVAHLLSAQLSSSTQCFEKAVKHYIAASALTDERGQLHCIAQAFNFTKVLKDFEKPQWWNDQDLLKLSKQAVILLPNLPTAWDMRAHVLVGQIDWPEKRVRTVNDFEEAKQAFLQHASMNNVSRTMLLESAEMCEYLKAEAQ